MRGVANGSSPCKVVITTFGGIEDAVTIMHHRGHDGRVFKHLSDGKTLCAPKTGTIELVASITMFVASTYDPVVEYCFCNLLWCEVQQPFLGRAFVFAYRKLHHIYIGIDVEEFQVVAPGARTHAVVRIKKCDDIARGSVESGIACSAEASIRLMDDAYLLRVAFGVFIANCAALVRGTVINQQDLKVVHSLLEYAFQAPIQIGLGVIYGDDDT